MLTLIEGPQAEPVTLEDQKDHMNVTFDDQNSLIEELVAAATQKLDGASGLLGRCLITQRWRLTLDKFSPKILLPLAPVQSVQAVTYIDGNGVEQTHTAWSLYGLGNDDAYLMPAFNTSWPSTRAIPEAVKIDITAGYGDEPEAVPEPLRQAIRLWAAHLYDNRPSTSEDAAQNFVRPIDIGFYQHIADLRRFSF